MCGLSGLIVSHHDSTGITHSIQAMNHLIQHRGSDDEGFLFIDPKNDRLYIQGGTETPTSVYTSQLPYSPKQTIANLSDTPIGLALGHRRLSIVDLTAAGHQPMCDPTQRYWVVYNGEIYNHLELRAELETLGHNFFTHCDTEILLTAYAQWGTACLDRFNGMFAFLLYDRLEQTLFAARDRFGIKPLYYWIAPDRTIAFGSEIKQFTALPGWQARMNPQRVYDFLVWSLTDHTEETCFAGVYQLPPGEFIQIDCRRYWQGQIAQPSAPLPTQSWYKLEHHPLTITYSEATEQVRELLKDAVRLRLRADVPVGSCLSGGIDSSSIVCLMNNLLQGKGSQKTFTACAKVDRFDERHWAETVVLETGATPHYLYPSLENLWDILPNLTWHQDEPFGSTSIYAQWCVFQAATQAGIRVMLDGQGSDEQFCGYYFFFSALLRDYFNQGQWRAMWSELLAIEKQHGLSKIQQLQATFGPLLPQLIQDALLKILKRTPSKPSWFNVSNQITLENPFKHQISISNPLTTLIQQQLSRTNLPMLLHWEDRNSMAHAIEARVPFTDYRLINLTYNLPASYKIKLAETKHILRSSMAGIIPSKIQHRRDKLGFVTPEEVWLKQQPDLFRQAVQEAVKDSHGLLNHSALTLTDQMIAGQIPFSFLPWRFISFGLWVKVFQVQL